MTVATNEPPVFTSTPIEVASLGFAYEYQVKTQDPDGDAVTYRLEAAPDGMQIDPQTGRITWDSATGLSHQVIVVATDAPLDARQLRRVAKRALLGLGAVGSPMSHGSGDYVIAFSTAETTRQHISTPRQPQSRVLLADEALSPLFQATREATEEAIVNSLLKATTVTGYKGRTIEAIPVQRVIEICRKYGAIQ